MDRLCVHILTLSSVLSLSVAAPSVQAGSKKAKVEFSYRMAPDGPKIRVDESAIYVRPNAEHEIELFVKNVETDKEEDALKDVTVRLMRLDSAGKAVGLATAKLVEADKNEEKVDKLPSGKGARLLFVPDKAPPWTGPPAKHQLWLDAKNKDTVKQDLKVQLEHPVRYLDVKARYDRATNRISFLVSLKDNFVGPPCTVQLVLDRDYVPGMKLVKRGTLEQKLTKIGQELELFADLEFEGTAVGPADARVFLNVDGFERALEYLPNFNDLSGQIGSADYSKDVAVRFRTKRYVVPDKKTPITVTLEIDARRIDQPARVEFGFNRSEDNKDDDKFETVPTGGLPGLRDVKLTMGAGKNGELVCRMTVVDWKVTLNTADMFGRRWLRVRVLDESGKTEKLLSRKALTPLEAGRGGWTPLILNSNRVEADVTLDESAVEGVKFTNLPAEWIAGKDLPVKVATKPREPESRYAPIEKAIFYLGKPGDKIPEDELYRGTFKDGVWTALLRTPDKPGKQPVTVQFKTGNGRESVESDFVMLKVAKPGDILATLKGKVVDAADRGFPGVKVQLKDAKGAVKDEQKSVEKGAFTFEKVAPGDYVIEATSVIPASFGRIGVAVPPGKDVIEKDVQVKMK